MRNYHTSCGERTNKNSKSSTDRFSCCVVHLDSPLEDSRSSSTPNTLGDVLSAKSSSSCSSDLSDSEYDSAEDTKVNTMSATLLNEMKQEFSKLRESSKQDFQKFREEMDKSQSERLDRLEEKFSNNIEKIMSRFNTLENKVTNCKSEIKTVSSKLETCQTDMKRLDVRQSNLEQSNKLLERKFDDIEEHSKKMSDALSTYSNQRSTSSNIDNREVEERHRRANNVIIFGVEESVSGSPQERESEDRNRFAKLLEDINFPARVSQEIIRVLRLGQKKSGVASPAPRPLMITLTSPGLAYEILRAGRLMPNLIKIRNDQTPAQRDEILKLRAELSEIKKKNPTATIKYTHGTPKIVAPSENSRRQ